jgi:hypothetical protein
LTKQIKITDMENAELFGDFYGNKFCYIPENNRYVQFVAGAGWQDADGLLLARDFIKDLHNQASRSDDKMIREALGSVRTS